MFSENWRQEMLDKAVEEAEARNIAVTTLGGIIVNDADFFPDIESGKRSCTMKTYEKVMGWFQENTKKRSKRKAPVGEEMRDCK